jgi:hypothetical protein
MCTYEGLGKNHYENSFWVRLFHKKWLPYFFLSVIFLVLVIPMTLKTETGVSGSRDEVQFRLYQIITYTQQFPYLDFKNVRPSQTPLYHVMLMFMAFIIGTDLVQLRLVSASISLICLLVIYRYLSERGDPLNGLLFSLIFLLSPYFVQSAIMLFSENTAFLFALLSLMMLDISILRKRHFLWANIFILLTVLTRQIYIWLVGVSLLFSFQNQQNKRLGINLKNALPSLMPLAGLAYFVFLWGGLSPRATSYSATTNWDALIYIISLLGLYGTFFAPWYFRLYRQNQDRRKTIYVVGLVIFGISYLLLHPVSNEYNIITRGGALWLLATYLPTLFSSSVIFSFLFPVGLIWLYITMQYLLSKRDYLMVFSFPLWLAANVANPRTYQRYYELFLLFFIGYSLVALKPERWKEWAGLILLPLFLAGMTMYKYVFPILLP